MNNRIKIRFIKEGELKMDVNNLTVIIALINLVIFMILNGKMLLKYLV